MPTGTWIITGVQGAGNDRLALLNCRIVGTSSGYDFKSPQPNSQVLGSSTSLSAPIIFRFYFPDQQWAWRVDVNNLNPRPSGSWSNNKPNSEGGIGTWEGGVGEGEEGEGGNAEGEHSAD